MEGELQDQLLHTPIDTSKHSEIPLLDVSFETQMLVYWTEYRADGLRRVAAADEAIARLSNRIDKKLGLK